MENHKGEHKNNSLNLFNMDLNPRKISLYLIISQKKL